MTNGIPPTHDHQYRRALPRPHRYLGVTDPSSGTDTMVDHVWVAAPSREECDLTRVYWGKQVWVVAPSREEHALTYVYWSEPHISPDLGIQRFEGATFDLLAVDEIIDPKTTFDSGVPTLLGDKHRLIETLRSFTLLETDWDGYLANPPSDESIRSAVNTIENLPDDRKLPRVSLGGEQEIILVWETPGQNIFLTINGETFHLLVKREIDRNLYFDDIPYTAGRIPNKILQHIPPA